MRTGKSRGSRTDLEGDPWTERESRWSTDSSLTDSHGPCPEEVQAAKHGRRQRRGKHQQVHVSVRLDLRLERDTREGPGLKPNTGTSSGKGYLSHPGGGAKGGVFILFYFITHFSCVFVSQHILLFLLSGYLRKKKKQRG